ncbi:MAG: GNAT family N-acetyltransferase [Litorimonas sp.]
MQPATTLGPTLETDRLILRPIDMDADFQGFAETFGDPDTMRYLGGQAKTPAQTWRSMATFLGHHLVRGYSFMSVIEKASGAWVGEVGPWYPEGWPGREVGWTLHPDHRGKGYAREAGRAAIDYARDGLGWASVIHIIEEGNTGSERVAEALGSTRQDTLTHISGIGDGVFNIYGQSF